MIKLGVNIDHVATVRQARKESVPDVVAAAKAAIEGGATGITAHLREDRRHIQDRDIEQLKQSISVPLNLEMAAVGPIVDIAVAVKPAWCCLVPEKRQELTTEGGLDVLSVEDALKETVARLQSAGIKVSLFIDADCRFIEASNRVGADAIEIHTGNYARMWKESAGAEAMFKPELQKIREAALLAKDLGLVVNAGHGIDYDNVKTLKNIFPFHEFNIGFAIIARAITVGIGQAVKEMRQALS